MFYKILHYNKSKYEYEDLFDFSCSLEEVCKIINDLNIIFNKLNFNKRQKFVYQEVEEEE